MSPKTHAALIEASLKKGPTAHNSEWTYSLHSFGGAVRNMILAQADYADVHLAIYHTRLGDDYVLGPLWADAVRNIRGLLNGETGPLDCGTLDGLLLAMLNLEGFTAEG